ncbi:MAG: antitoxin [Bacteroidetes bacterium 46-16]|nr:MAG: antitoxin [Bacteroidetes bacterium 46-16]
MDIELKVWLQDIITAINEIDSFFADRPRVFEAFKQDIKTKRAVERNLEIIGEAVSRVLRKDSSLLISNSKKIIGTSNRIIHGYDNISDEMIWSIVINHLPILKEEINQLLGL